MKKERRTAFCRIILLSYLLLAGWQHAAAGRTDDNNRIYPWWCNEFRYGDYRKDEYQSVAYKDMLTSASGIFSVEADRPDEYTNSGYGRSIKRKNNWNRFMVYHVLKISRTVPAYTVDVLNWTYELWYSKGPESQITLYLFDDMATLKSTNVYTAPFRDADDKNSPGHEYLLDFIRSSSNILGNTISPKRNTCAIKFDNSQGSEPITIEKYLLFGSSGWSMSLDHWLDGTVKTISYNYESYYPSLKGDGTEEYPLLISSGADLKLFADLVNAKRNTLHAKLMENIDYTAYNDVSAMIGNPDSPYMGVFDGNGHTIKIKLDAKDTDNVGLFRWVADATVKDLYLPGSVTGNREVGSLIGYAKGNVTVNDVISSAEVTGANLSDLSSGGLVGVMSAGNNGINTLTMTNCAFRGKLLPDTGSNNWGGLVGLVKTGSSATLDRCYFAPSSVNGNSKGSQNFVRHEGNNVTISKCYYTAKLGAEEQGTQVSDSQMASGEVCWLLNGEKRNRYWLQTLGVDKYPTHWYSLAVNKNEDKYYNFDSSFRGAGTEFSPFEIENYGQLAQFRDLVNQGYTDICAKLVTDIDLAQYNWMPIGNTDSTQYVGVFDGNGYTVSNLNVDGYELDVLMGGLFGYIKEGATVKNTIIYNATVKCGIHAGTIAGRCGGATIENCGAYGDLYLKGSPNGADDSGIAYCTENSNLISCFADFPNLSLSIKEVNMTCCFCGDQVAVNHATGWLTCQLNNGGPNPWRQNLGKDEYPRLRGAQSVRQVDPQLPGLFENYTYTVSPESGYLSTTAGKDFRVIHHGGRLYELIITVGTKDEAGSYTMPDANVTIKDQGTSRTILSFFSANADSLDFEKDWWGKVDIKEGILYDTRTYNRQVPTFWSRQGNHTDHKESSMLWLAPEDVNTDNLEFELKGTAADTKFIRKALIEAPVAPGDDSGLNFVEPIIGVTQPYAGHGLSIVTSSYGIYAVAVWDATDNRFVSQTSYLESVSNVNLDLPQLESYHNMVAIVYSRAVQYDTNGNPDTTFVNYAFPFVEKPTHSLFRHNVAATYNAANRIEWGIAFPNDSDMVTDDVWLVARAYKEDYSDLATLGNVSMTAFDRTVTENDTLYGMYRYVDTSAVDYSQIVNTSDTLSAFDTWNLSATAKAALEAYQYPAQYLYYQIYRPLVVALWAYSDGFYQSWKVLQTNVLPTVDTVRIIKDQNYEKNRKVTVRVVLNNPYPWEVVPESDYDAVQAEAIRNQFGHRMFAWDKNARIQLNRFSTSDEYDDGVDVIRKEFVISGDQVRQDARTGAYYVEYQDVASVPFVHYRYSAVVIPSESGYPICKDKNVAKVSKDECYCTEYGIVSNLQASRGTLTGAVALTWDADEFSGTTLDLKRRVYQRGWEAAPSPQEWISVKANDGQAMDDRAGAAVVNEYILTITTKYRDHVWVQSDTAYGYASYYGKLKGRVQLSNGVNMPGDVSVLVNGSDVFELNRVVDPRNQEVVLPAFHADSLKYLLKTDESGWYELDSVLFCGSGKSYSVSAACGTAKFEGPNGTPVMNLIYEDAKCEYGDINFTCSDTRHFSGRVLFSNSTAPVRDAYVKVNGTVLRNVNGEPLSSDAMGNFSFLVPKMEVTVQIVKDAHQLVGDGFILGGENADQKTFIPTHDYDGLLIYDDTKVRLVGRLAGGDFQGKKPLGFGTGTNNLGDSITVVLKLEGDNTSYLYFDAKNPDKTSYSQTFTQAVHCGERMEQRIQTQVSFEAKRIVVKADNKTGEFCLDLLPAKYVLSQIYANGYASLYSEGEGQTVLDLGDSVGVKTHYLDEGTYTQYDASFRKIYHSPVEVELLQLRNNKYRSVFGAESIKVGMLSGTRQMQTSWIDETTGEARYTLGYPVFKGNGYYSFQVRAYEPYYYNNEKSGRYESVPMAGFPVSVSNGLTGEKDNSTEGLVLDDAGKAVFGLVADNSTFSMTEEDALRYLSASVNINGYNYESEPVAAFVTGERDYGVEVATAYESMPTIIDYIRDPYGAHSYAYRETGTKYSWAHHLYSNKQDVVTLSMGIGMGISSSAGALYQMNATYTIKASGNLNFVASNTITHLDGEMSMTLTDRLATSSDPSDQGAMADIYLGKVSTMDIWTFKTINLLDEVSYSTMKPAIESGVAKLVKEGVNAAGEPVYLVICGGVTAAPGTERVFAYTQKHILTHVIPELKARRDETFRLAADWDEAVELCNTSGRIIYYPKGDSYGYVFPGTSAAVQDTVKMLDEQIAAWEQLIADNEKIKIEAMRTTASPSYRYSLSSGTTLNHSEDASTYFRFRSADGPKPITGSVSVGTSGSPTPAMGGGKKNNNQQQAGNNDNGNGSSVLGYGILFDLSLGHRTSGSSSSDYDDYTTFTGASGYCIDACDNSYYDMDVYRESDASVVSVNETFRNDINSYESGQASEKLDLAQSGSQMMDDSISTIHSYVYVMRGGATRNPWTDADSTWFYKPNGVRLPLGTRTLRIDNPKIYVENPVVNNTPQDEKAIFTVRMTNESEMGTNYDGLASTLILKVKENSNPFGAKLFVDGQAIGNGLEYNLKPGQSISKTLEIERGGKPFDYENIVLTLSDKSQSLSDQATVSVHYLPVSTPLTLTLPAQNFLINTLSQKDNDGKYFIPVQIEGFSTTRYENFDHIELQYKRQIDGEDQWVNLCSYYVDDSLYRLASGTREMITTEGRISNIRFFGEKDPVEMKYDLRAVSFCRLGNGYTTRISPVISGTKDTRCPEVFGLPKPADGILDFDDVISLPFTEPIAYNYLDETANFSIQGYTNSSDMDNSVSLNFSGSEKQSAVSMVSRSLSAMDFSVEMNVRVEPEALDSMSFMALNDDFSEDYKSAFVFGYNSRKDMLVAAMGGQCVYSKPLKSGYQINLESALTHVGMVYSVNDSTVQFYVGEQEIDILPECRNTRLDCRANGVVSLGTLFKGQMNNIRLWSKALDAYEMMTKYGKVLSSNESNLLGYWPANEASGTVVKDESNGASLILTDVTWKLPDGYSVDLDRKPMDICDKTALEYSRDEKEDYFLSFYFKVDELDGDANLFAAGRDNLDEKGKGKMRIRFIDGVLCFVSEGESYPFGIGNDLVSSHDWHYLAVSVNHSQNKASLFIDGLMVNEVSADAIGGMANTGVQYGDKAIHAHIDQIQLWSVALPASYISRYYNAALSGKEKELRVYLPFEREEQNAQGTMYTAFSAFNHVIVEQTGEIAGDTAVIEASLVPDSRVTAPVRSATGIENLPFSWKSTDNELQISVNISDAQINNQYINLIVRRVEDLNGNVMKNPQMWSTYVNRNVLTWNEKVITILLPYQHDTIFTTSFSNASGRNVNYTIDCSNPYLSFSQTMGTIAPLGTSFVGIRITDGLAPGVYSAMVNLTDEDGLTSRQTINIVVRASAPSWKVTTDPTYKQSMNVAAVVKKQKGGTWIVDMCSQDIVAAFINDVCVGVSKLTVDVTNNTSYVFLTVLGKEELQGSEVKFRLFNAVTGETCQLMTGTVAKNVWTDKSITFSVNSIVGGDKSLEMRTTETKYQTIGLKKGWNWISLNAISLSQMGLNNLFEYQTNLTPNDLFKHLFEGFAYFQSNYKWESSLDSMLLSKNNVYQMYVQNDATVVVPGIAFNDDNRYVTLNFSYSDWAELPYLLESALPTRMALSDFVPGSAKAPAGTLIKGYDGFAIACEDGTWFGSLTTMRPGEGYYVYRNGLRESVQIRYTNTSKANSTKSQTDGVTVENAPRTSSSSMPVIAVFGDGDWQMGDVLVAIADGKVVGRAQAMMFDNSYRFLLSVHAEDGQKVTFAKERNGEVVGMTTKSIGFDGQGILGSLERPYLIDFDGESADAIYDVTGVRYRDSQENLPSDRVFIVGDKKVINRK